MRSANYDFDFMTFILEIRKPHSHSSSYEDLAPRWEEPVRKPRVFKEFPPIPTEVFIGSDEQPIGWLPPLYPPTSPYAARESPHRLTSMTYVPPRIVNGDSYPDTNWNSFGSNSPSSSSTSSYSTPPGSPSPFRLVRWGGKGPIPRTGNQNGSLERSPLQNLQGKERKKIRQSSGVKYKTKTPRTHSPRDLVAGPHPKPASEMVQCMWEGCTTTMYVDYVNVKHWGKHIREHYTNQPEMIQCQWAGGCGAAIKKSSLWKHIVVHQPRFKLRCPHGCDVFTRADMMKRHLNTCPFLPSRAAAQNESDEGGD